MKRMVKADIDMKRQIEGNSQSEFRVVTIGLDVVIPSDADGSQTADYIYEVLNELDHRAMRLAAADFKEDVTDMYEREYPSELYLK